MKTMMRNITAPLTNLFKNATITTDAIYAQTEPKIVANKIDRMVNQATLGFMRDVEVFSGTIADRSFEMRRSTATGLGTSPLISGRIEWTGSNTLLVYWLRHTWRTVLAWTIGWLGALTLSLWLIIANVSDDLVVVCILAAIMATMLVASMYAKWRSTEIDAAHKNLLAALQA